MKQFMDKDFLLDTATAKHLFHDYAEHMPIIDYHCHISPQEIAEDHHSAALPKYGSAVTTINGASFVPMGHRKKRLPGQNRQIWKNSSNMRKLFHELLAIRCIIGVIWNCSAILALPNR